MYVLLTTHPHCNQTYSGDYTLSYMLVNSARLHVSPVAWTWGETCRHMEHGTVHLVCSFLFDVQLVFLMFFSTFIPSRMSNNWKTYMLFCRILFQFMPAILMTSFYTTIFLKVRQQERLMQRYTYKQKVTCQHRLTWLKFERKTINLEHQKIIINNTHTHAFNPDS